jgi:hypothetical protein
MLTVGYEGPKEQWHAELESVNKLGLLTFIEILMTHLDALTGGMDRESLLKTVRNSKKYGKWDAMHKRFKRIMENPQAVYEEKMRRSRAAKKAARRRKKNR